MARGVVHRKNGKWGAKIYTKNKETWLGTFKSEKQAALAYDRASFKLKGKDSLKNVTNKHILETELYFQNQCTDDSIVKMIKDHSYDKRLQQMKLFPDLNLTTTEQDEHLQPILEKLPRSSMIHKPHKFCKALTVSDIGPLSRLLIPKIHAKNQLPIDMLHNRESIPLKFIYNHHEEWEFQFKYWTSSQSYVFTGTWREFVKDKRLEAGDTIYFTRDHTKENTYHITISPSREGRNPGAATNVSTKPEKDFRDSEPTELVRLPKEEPTELVRLPKEEPTGLGWLPKSWGGCQRRSWGGCQRAGEAAKELERLPKDDLSDSKPAHYG